MEAVKAAEQGEVPVGAVVVCRDRIIGRGHNLTETLNDVTAHAEMQAVTAAANTLGGKYLNECTLYVTVEPCVMCAGAIAWAQTGKLVFGAEDPKRGYQKYAPDTLHPKTIVVKGILISPLHNLHTLPHPHQRFFFCFPTNENVYLKKRILQNSHSRHSLDSEYMYFVSGGWKFDFDRGDVCRSRTIHAKCYLI